MNSSGIKRGLAVSAISALAIAGIPQFAAPASAVTHNDLVGPGAVVLFNDNVAGAGADAPLSIVNDGTDTTVRLEAAAGADFTSLTFQYALPVAAPATPVFVDIATVQRNDDGGFSFEWAPPAGIIGQTITLRATGTSTAAGNATVTDDATLVQISNTAPSVNITAGTARGVFDTPYTADGAPVTGTGTGINVRLAGTASSTANVTLAAAGVAGTTVVAPAAVAPSTTPTFAGSLDITGYNFAGDDELATSATVTGGSQDFEGFTLYNQVITTVTAAASATNVPIGSPNPTITVTVNDQNGNPVVGAEVRNNAGALVGYTNANGQVSTTQAPGTTASYYANATDNNPFLAAEGDKTSADITITQFAPVVTRLDATSRDGAAFDFDENAAGDIVVQAKDQNGGNLDVNDAQDLSYYWVLTPFDGAPATVRFPATGTSTVATDTNGAFTVPLPAGAGVESGTYELFAGLTDVAATPADESFPVASRLVVKVGQSALTFDGANPQSAPAGTSSPVSGRLALEDGTALAGRTVRLTYTRGAGSDATPDSGFTDGADAGTDPDATVDVVTSATGAFSATVVDPAETGVGAVQGTELGGTVTATTIAGTAANNPDGDNPNAAAATRVVNFVTTVAPAGTTVVIADIAAIAKPGTVVSGSALVTVADGADAGTDRDPVAGQQVTLTLPAASGAYFTNGTPAPAPVVGADIGTFNNLGKSITVTSNAAGQVTFQLAMGRDAGFDDDGLAEAIVTATAGTATAPAVAPSDTEDVDFDSANPLNGGEVQLVLSPAGEQEGGTTPASVDQDVFFDVFTTDQLGNRVGGEFVTITAEGDDDDTDVDINGSSVSDFDSDGDFSVSADQADDVTVTGTWIADTIKYAADNTNDTDPVTPGVQGDAGTELDVVTGTETLTDTAEVTFADEAPIVVGTTTLTGNPETRATVNTAVTETFTLKDTTGAGIAGVTVTFDRSGAGGSASVQRVTDANGVATYTFTSAEEGLTTIAANATFNGSPVSATDSVTFGPEEVNKRPIRVNTTGGQANGGRTDIIRIRVTSLGTPAGAKATLFRKVGNRNVRVAVKTVGANNRAEFRVRDRNGVNRLTSYFVVVGQTDDTLGRRGPVKKFR